MFTVLFNQTSVGRFAIQIPAKSDQRNNDQETTPRALSPFSESFLSTNESESDTLLISRLPIWKRRRGASFVFGNPPVAD